MSEPKVCVVTGGASGIGRAAAEQLARAGHRPVLVGRDADRAEATCSAIDAATGHRPKFVRADLSSQGAVRDLAASLLSDFPRIDVLINNAARPMHQEGPTLTRDDVEEVWAVNHLAPFLLTSLLAKRLAASEGRVLNVSAEGLAAHPFLRLDFDDLDSRETYEPTTAYFRSKLAQCAFTVVFQERHPEVATNIVRVTPVSVAEDSLPTDLDNLWRTAYRVRQRHAVTPEAMAEVYVWAALDERAGALRGQHLDHRRRAINHPTAIRDDSLLDQLWSRSAIQTEL